jgi:hypothetical protein
MRRHGRNGRRCWEHWPASPSSKTSTDSAARESADKAIALDPALAAGYLALGLIQINHDWDWEGADI